MHGQLRSELEIHKQLYSIAFLSSSLSMVYPLLMGCLWLPFLVLLLERGFIYPALPHTFFNDTLCPEPSNGYLYFPLGTTALPLERKVPFPHFWCLWVPPCHHYHCQEIPLFLLKPELEDFWGSLCQCQCPIPGSPSQLRNQRGKNGKITTG